MIYVTGGHTYRFLFSVELIALGCKALHRNEQVSQRVLESLPVVNRVEKLDDECLDLHSVHVSELALETRG